MFKFNVDCLMSVDGSYYGIEDNNVYWIIVNKNMKLKGNESVVIWGEKDFYYGMLKDLWEEIFDILMYEDEEEDKIEFWIEGYEDYLIRFVDVKDELFNLKVLLNRGIL